MPRHAVDRNTVARPALASYAVSDQSSSAVDASPASARLSFVRGDIKLLGAIETGQAG